MQDTAIPPSATLRNCQEHDMADVLAIYAPYVRDGLASFELDAPSLEEMKRRRRNLVERGFPYLVAEHAGRIVGYAYAGPYRPRPAYRLTVESSVYVLPDRQRLGLGRLLLGALLAECERMGACQVVAMIGDSANRPSIGLHASLGFRYVGMLVSVGFKFGRWVDAVSMQRELGNGDDRAPDR